MNVLPIRKIAVAALAALITYVVQRVGLDLGPAAVEQAAAAVVGLVAGYLTPDPRVLPATVRP